MHAQGLSEMKEGFFKSAVLKKDCSISTKQVEDVDVRITTSILFACGMWSLVIGLVKWKGSLLEQLSL